MGILFNKEWFTIPIEGIDNNALPAIKVFGNNISYLTTKRFPWEGNGSHITEKMITEDMAAFIGAKVFRKSRDRFVIESNTYDVIAKTLAWLDKAARTFDKRDVMQVVRAFLNCGSYCDEAFRQYQNKGIRFGVYDPGLFPYEEFLHEAFPKEFLLWVDKNQEDQYLIQACENILHTGSLRAESYMDDSGKSMVLISYKGQEYNIPYQEDETDRNITMITLNKAHPPRITKTECPLPSRERDRDSVMGFSLVYGLRIRRSRPNAL